MAYKVIYSNEAKLQLAAVLNYWCDAGGGNYAARLLQKMNALADRLVDFPEMYRKIETLNLDAETRIAPVDEYVILYRIYEPDKLVVIGKIISGRSNYLSIN